VTRDELDRAWTVFEPPTADELALVDVVHTYR